MRILQVFIIALSCYLPVHLAYAHHYINGICTDAACDAPYEPALLAIEGHYDIYNLGHLYWFTTEFNKCSGTLRSSDIQLKADIHMGRRTDFPGIGSSSNPYTGTFDGGGHLIRGLYRIEDGAQPAGLINCAQNACIRNLTVGGDGLDNLSSLKLSNGVTSGGVIGIAIGERTRIEDLSSNIAIFCDDATIQSIGGIVGEAEGIINRCRFNGQISVKPSISNAGGICGKSDKDLTISNCLYDGTISRSTNDNTKNNIGGLLGLSMAGKHLISNCLFNNGKGTNLSNCYYGSLIGKVASSATANIKTSFFNGTNQRRIGSGNAASEDATNASSFSWQQILDWLGTNDWILSSNKPIPHRPECSHTYDTAGWCTQCNARIASVYDANDVCQIQYLSQLISFADIVNCGGGKTCKAVLVDDIDFALLSADLEDPIGRDWENPFVGSFDGQGHHLSNIHVNSGNKYVGLFGCVQGASTEIKDLHVDGTIEAASGAARIDLVADMREGILSDVSSNTDYIISCLCLDDLCDTTYLPSLAASIKARRIVYQRSAQYMTDGYISVCMPFALSDASLPGGSACQVKIFNQVDGNTIYFSTIDNHNSLEAGTPYFLYLPENMRGQDWLINLYDPDGIDLCNTPVNPSNDRTIPGIYGELNTTHTGAWSEAVPIYKLNAAGNALLKTTAKSMCFPYRGYLVLPPMTAQALAANGYRLSFEDLEETTDLSPIQPSDRTNQSFYYNLQGQPIAHPSQGLFITIPTDQRHR